MMAALDPRAVERLAKLLGLLGSNHDGEGLAAARQAQELLRARGLSWADVLLRTVPGSDPRSRPAPGCCPPSCGAAQWALAHADRLTPREAEFLRDIVGRSRQLTPKQAAWLDRIVRRLRDALQARGGRATRGREPTRP